MQILNLSATLNVASLEPSINTYRLGEGAGTYEYPELNNKPQINGVTLVGDISSANLGFKTSDLTNDSGFISEADIPTATSDLVNDSGFINATQVQSVVSDAIPSDISYFNNDVGYITDADIGNIPTRMSQLINDSGYITAAEAPVTSVNGLSGAVDLDGTNIEYEQNVSLNAKIDAVEASIPTATSELQNDSGFITNANIPTRTSQLVNDSGFITNANIPTRTSQLVNDSGFVNAQNIPVQSVNGQTGEVELTAEDLSYDGSTTTVKDVVSGIDTIYSGGSTFTNDIGRAVSISPYDMRKYKFLRITGYSSNIASSQRFVLLLPNLYSALGANYYPCDVGGVLAVARVESTNGTFTLLNFTINGSVPTNGAMIGEIIGIKA